jgi:predicted AlkP superfamily pyrophosphatase or phosphodiesterase
MLKRLLLPQTVVSAAVLTAVLGVPQPVFANGNPTRTPSVAGAPKAPKVILISLDGAKPGLINQYLNQGVLNPHSGVGLIRRYGVTAQQNITATPSVTAVSHIAIATGSTAAHNDIPGNTFHPVGATITTSISGFAAPIGGYEIAPLGPTTTPTAEPLWVQLQNAGKKVVTATWPGSDGADIAISGVPVQTAIPTRTNTYTVPFGTFGGLSAQGFTLTGSSFGPDAAVGAELAAAGHPSYSPVQVTSSPLETFYCGSTTAGTCGSSSATRDLKFDMKVAALDSTNDGVTNYDTLAMFEASQGIKPGPFAAPSTGPAYVKVGKTSRPFYFEGTGNRIGTGYFATEIAADLSQVRFTRYSANYIPRNTAVLSTVDDVNNTIGFWRPQPDFRIPERISFGFTNFSDAELEAIYEDLVQTFTGYQTHIGQRAIELNRDADLVMIYLEQPDGSGHQFTLTDPRQATNFLDPTRIGTPGNPPGATGQDQAKVDRYRAYLEYAYQRSNRAVHEIITTAGLWASGAPRSNVFVVSDHGMAPFHTAVSLRNLLANAGIDLAKIGIRTTGPATNIYVNLQGRQPGGTVPVAEFDALVAQIADVLRNATDPNQNFNYSLQDAKVFTDVFTRPSGCAEGPGFCTSEDVGQDTGDVLALMAEGYNFDGTQSPGVARLGDTPYDAATTVFSVPNFFGAHGHNSELASMSASFLAAGPQIKRNRTVQLVRNIDVAPTIMHILGVTPAPTVDGVVLTQILK